MREKIIDERRVFNIRKFVLFAIIGLMFGMCMIVTKTEAKTKDPFNKIKKEYIKNSQGSGYCYWYNVKLLSGSKAKKKTMRVVRFGYGGTAGGCATIYEKKNNKYKKILNCNGDLISYGMGRKYILCRLRFYGMAGVYTVYKYDTEKKKYVEVANQEYDNHTISNTEEDVISDLSDELDIDIAKFKSFGSNKVHMMFDYR
ncbi:MAG: hypothetical protein E7271_00735 [Lachnospiraceae bacterium]|nr:hypothetical protein [Lachnospiraceae bacterium]